MPKLGTFEKIIKIGTRKCCNKKLVSQESQEITANSQNWNAKEDKDNADEESEDAGKESNVGTS